MAESLLIQYTNLLHEFRSPDAPPVREFREKHSDDKIFQKRAKILDEVFKLKEQCAHEEGVSGSAVKSSPA